MSNEAITALVEKMANERAKEILTEVACDLQELSESILSKALALEGRKAQKSNPRFPEGRPNRGKWALMLLNWRERDNLTQKQAATLIEKATKVPVRQYHLSTFEHGKRKDLDPELRQAIQHYLGQ